MPKLKMTPQELAQKTMDAVNKLDNWDLLLIAAGIAMIFVALHIGIDH